MDIVDHGGARPLSVIVFARRPRAGRVKRRLARNVGAAHAARIYAATLRRTQGEVECLAHARRIVMPAAAVERRWFVRHWAARGWRVRTQSLGDLGRRMAHALARELRCGRNVLLLGSDLADFCVADLRAAEAALASAHAVVFGPACDGGYWLVGLTQPLPGLFVDIPWSTAAVLRRSREWCDNNGIRHTSVALRRDLDRARDLDAWRPRRLQRRRAWVRSRLAT